MTAHSLLVGGSIASRRIACPASFQEGLRSPRQTGSSPYADHGTAMHSATAHWLKTRTRNPDGNLVGMTFDKFVVTQDDWDDLIVPAVDALDEMCEIYGGGFKIVAQEKTVQFPGIPGAFGTLDIVLQSKTHTLIPDFKFGAGVNVNIIGDNDELNAQALFYAGGARALFKDRKLVIGIIQPTFEPHLKHVEVSLDQLDAFEVKLVDAVTNSVSDNPKRVRGEHCRFAHCKATCILWAGPLLDLSKLGKPANRPADPTDNAWGKYLAAAMVLVDSAVMFRKEINEALIEHLRNGGKAPGFALKQQVKNRRWLDDVEFVAKSLKKLGFKDNEIWQRKLATFATTDKVAKKLGVEIPASLRPQPPSTDLALTYEGDPSTIEPHRLTAEFSAALKRLSNS